MKKTTLLGNTAVWLGAAISVAEIFSGAMIAAVGMRSGLLAIIIGHILGGILFFLCGKIGADTGLSSMSCVSLSFGKHGSGVFALMNAAQLTVWTILMLHISAQLLVTLSASLLPLWAWCLIIGAAVLLWLFFSNAQISYVNLITSELLLGLTFYMCYHSVQTGLSAGEATGFAEITFGSAIEISAAVPIAWLPLVADYTSKAEKPRLNNILSTLVYIGGSGWMFFIGLWAALACGTTDLVQVIIRMDLLRIPLIIILLATVTSTFIESRSAGISAQILFKNYTVRMLAMIMLTVATVFSMLIRLNNFDVYLLVIASVFAPMSAIMVTDYFLLRHTTDQAFDMGAMLLWAVGFVMYHLFLSVGLPCGSTIPVVVILICIRCITEKSWSTNKKV